MNDIPICAIHGRFQPLHHGHMEYLLAGISRCSLLIIGITNPDPWQTKEETTDVNRGMDLSNPCTFYERLMMIEGSLCDSGITRDAFRIVPFPISFPERIGHYAPMDAEFLVTIYDEWGDEKLRRLQDLKLRTHLLWRRTEKVTTGTFVRDAIASGRSWEHLVPAATAKVVRASRIDDRIRRLAFDAARSTGKGPNGFQGSWIQDFGAMSGDYQTEPHPDLETRLTKPSPDHLSNRES